MRQFGGPICASGPTSDTPRSLCTRLRARWCGCESASAGVNTGVTHASTGSNTFSQCSSGVLGDALRDQLDRLESPKANQALRPAPSAATSVHSIPPLRKTPARTSAPAHQAPGDADPMFDKSGSKRRRPSARSVRLWGQRRCRHWHAETGDARAGHRSSRRRRALLGRCAARRASQSASLPAQTVFRLTDRRSADWESRACRRRESDRARRSSRCNSNRGPRAATAVHADHSLTANTTRGVDCGRAALPSRATSRSSTPGRKPSISASARSTSRSNTSRPSADFKSIAIERLPRFTASNAALTVLSPSSAMVGGKLRM